jgi:acyl-CoA synthetase (NDP forming)
MPTPSDVIATAKKEGRKQLLEHEAKELVKSAGVVVPRSVVVGPDDPQAAAAAAEQIGFPVALKALSPDIVHKTEAGAVMLNIASGPALAASIPTMKKMIAARTPGARVTSLLIEKMMPQGLELLVGGIRDEQFGPALSFGLGGVWVEALRDAAFGILPMTQEEMLDMIAQTRAGLFLTGFRGQAPVDREAVLAALGAVSRLLTEHPAIREIDMNPVRVYAKGAIALDVRIILA